MTVKLKCREETYLIFQVSVPKIMSITFSPKLHDPHPILKSETKDCLLKFDSDLKLETARKLSSQDIGQGVRKLIGHLVPLFGENVSSSHTDVVDILLENLVRLIILLSK